MICVFCIFIGWMPPEPTCLAPDIAIFLAGFDRVPQANSYDPGNIRSVYEFAPRPFLSPTQLTRYRCPRHYRPNPNDYRAPGCIVRLQGASLLDHSTVL